MTEQETPQEHTDEVEEHALVTVQKDVMTLYVDRSLQHWIVRDAEGCFWALPGVDDAWSHRQPFQPTGDTTLEPVPGHYKSVLGIPR